MVSQPDSDHQPPAPLDIDEPYTLADGTQLDERQTRACILHATEDLTHEQIAHQAGYASGPACSRWLRSARGREGVELALRQHLLEGARIGLQQALWTVRKAKSERLRWEAAQDLMDRAQLKEAEPDDGSRRAGSLSININVNGDEHDDRTIDITPE